MRETSLSSALFQPSVRTAKTKGISAPWSRSCAEEPVTIQFWESSGFSLLPRHSWVEAGNAVASIRICAGDVHLPHDLWAVSLSHL